MRNKLHKVCVFCGANAGVRPRYAEVASTLGETLGRQKLDLVYGGGSVGLMGIVARSAESHGCHVVGIIPSSLTSRELMGQKIGELIVVDTMHERKARMAALADAFIALPGGFGTLDELFEAITWAQLGLHAKPIGLLNVDGYFDGLVQFIDNAIAEGFIRPHYRQLFILDVDAEKLLDQLRANLAPPGLTQSKGLDTA